MIASDHVEQRRGIGRGEEHAGAKLISRVQMYCELQRDWAREATVPGFMDVLESFDGFNPEKAAHAA
ncbi:hypothetical protein [Sphingobium ummariense]